MESQPTSSNKTVLIIGVVAIVVLLLCCICVTTVVVLGLYTDVLSFLPFFGPQWGTASAVPADTDFLVAMNPNLEDLSGYQHLSEVYDQALEETGAKEDLEESLEEMEDELGVSFEEDIQPWLGKEVGVAIADFEELAEGEQPAVVIVAETRDRKASDAFLEKVRQHLEDQDYNVEEETYKDVTYYVQEVEFDWETPVLFGTVGKYVVLATDAAGMEGVIDVSKGDADSLAKNADYAELLKRLPGDAAVIAYYDMQGFMDVFLADTAFELPEETAEMLEAYKAFGMAVTLGTEGVQLDFAMTFDPEELPESALRGLEPAGGPERVLRRIPSDALGFIASRIPSNYWEDFRTTLEENPELEEQLQDFEDATGLKLEEALGWMTGELAIAVVEAEETADIPIGVFGMFETSDMEAAKDALEDLGQILEEQMRMEFEEKEIGDVEMQVIVAPYTEQVMGGYGFSDPYVIIGFTEDALEAAVDDSVDPITNNETFKRVQAHLPSNSTGYFYFNVEGIWQLVYDSMSEYEQEDFDEEARPLLEPIKAIGMAGHRVDPQEGYLQFTAFIYIP